MAINLTNPIPFIVTPEIQPELKKLMIDPATGQSRAQLDPEQLRSFLEQHPSALLEEVVSLRVPMLLPPNKDKEGPGTALVGLWKSPRSSVCYIIRKNLDENRTFVVEVFPNELTTGIAVRENTPDDCALVVYRSKGQKFMHNDPKGRLSHYIMLSEAEAEERIDNLAGLVKNHGVHINESGPDAPCDCAGHRSLRNMRFSAGSIPNF